MTLSLDEAAMVIDRNEALVAWGVGCHPVKALAQNTFDPAVSRTWELRIHHW